MSYDNKTNTITVSSNADETSALMDLGVSHVYELRILARRASASSGLLADWKTIEPMPVQQLDERGRGKLRALIAVEDFRCAVARDGFLDRLEAEVGG